MHLVLDSPLLNPQGKMHKSLQIIDMMITIVFTVEALLKIFVYGLFFNGSTSYFRNIWNVFDYTIVICSVRLFL